jgi:hypothetical protein
VKGYTSSHGHLRCSNWQGAAWPKPGPQHATRIAATTPAAATIIAALANTPAAKLDACMSGADSGEATMPPPPTAVPALEAGDAAGLVSRRTFAFPTAMSQCLCMWRALCKQLRCWRVVCLSYSCCRWHLSCCCSIVRLVPVCTGRCSGSGTETAAAECVIHGLTHCVYSG